MLTPTTMIVIQMFAFGFVIDTHAAIGKPKAPKTQSTSPDQPVDFSKKARMSPEALAHQALQLSQVRVYPLQHASAHSVADALDKILPIFHASRFYSDNRTNSIVLVGPKENLEKIVEMLKALDSPPKEIPAEEEMVRIPIKYRDAKGVESKLYSLNSNFQFADSLMSSVDEERSAIILSGPKDQIAKAREVISQLDTPTGTVRLEFAFFQAQPDDDPAARPIPKDLVEVANELKRFGHISLIGRLSTIAVESQTFSVSGQISDQLVAQVEGRLLSAISDDAVKVELESNMMLFKPFSASTEKNENKRQSRSTFELQTVVTTRMGDYVVLGSAPSGWSAGQSAILVLHVLP